MDQFSLRCFLMLAEQLNFTKTASVMNVSQPTLSRIIAALEHEVGTPLFNRSKQAITITAAGKEFALYAESIVRSCDYAIRRAKIAAGNGSFRLRLGFLPVMCSGILPIVAKRMQEEHPEVKLVLEPHSQTRLITEINQGNLDLALIMHWRTEALIQCEVEQFFQDDYYVAMNPNHPLSQRESLRVEDIAHERCLFYRAMADFRTYSSSDPGPLFLQMEMDNKDRLEETDVVNDIIGLMTLLECNEGVGILPYHIKRVALPELKFVRMRKENDAGIPFRGLMCWRRSNDNPSLEILRKVVRETGEIFSTAEA